MNILRKENFYYSLITIFASIFYVIFVLRTSISINGMDYYSLFDDAMISMRYASNFAAGYGLVWNPLEFVEGYSNFLWVIWMSVLHLIPVHESKISLLVSISGIVILVLNLFIVKSLAQKLTNGSFIPTALSMTFTAFSYSLVFWTLRGMEVGLLTLFINYAILLIFYLQDNFTNQNFIKLILILLCSLLLRTDSLIIITFLLIYFFFTVKTKSKIKIIFISIISITILLLLQTIFRIIYYDDILPNTYYLKLSNTPILYRLERGILVFKDIFLTRLLPFTLPILLYIYFYYKQIVKSRVFCLSGVFLIVSLYSIYIGGDSWEWMSYPNRYITLSIPSLIIIFSIGLEKLFYKFKSTNIFLVSSFIFLIYIAVICFFSLNYSPEYSIIPETPWINGPSIILLGLIYLFLLIYFAIVFFGYLKKGKSFSLILKLNFVLISFIIFVITNQYAYSAWIAKNAFYVEQDSNNVIMGLQFNENTSSNARIAVRWAGNQPYFSKRFSIDLMGKMDKYIAKSKTSEKIFLPGHSKWNYAYSLTTYKPDIIIDLYNMDDDVKGILENEYDLLSSGLYIRKHSLNVNRNYFY